jgi:hypothetical protein
MAPPLTVVTAYYDMPSKFTNETYLRWIELLLRTMNCNLVFFVENEASVKKLEAWCSWPSRVVFRIVRKDDWIMLKRSGIGFWDDQLRMDAREVNLHKSFMLGAVWAEKMHFVRRAIEDNPFQSTKFVWCDAGIMREDRDANRAFLFGCNEQVISDTHFHLLQVGHHAGPVSTKWWIPSSPSEVRFGGGIFGAHRDVWLTVIPKYEAVLDEMAADGECVFKDQIVWANLILREPSLFSITHAPNQWFHLLEAWSLPPPASALNTFVINLHHRRDRWEDVRKVWNLDVQPNVYRFPALKHGEYAPWLKSKVTHGCAASHLSVIMANNSNSCLVLEDDADPAKDTVTLSSLVSMLRDLQNNFGWDFVNFGTSTVSGLHQQQFGAVRSFNDAFWETKISSTTHAMGYSKRMKDHVPELLGIVRSTFFVGETLSNIDYVLGSGLVHQKATVQLIPKEGVLSVQRLSHSDISDIVADYSFMFQIVNAQLSWMRNSWIPMPLPIIADMQGGLGNQLFVAAAALRLAQKTGRPFALCRTPLQVNPHSNQNYMQTVFAKFPQLDNVPMHWCSPCATDADCLALTSTTIIPRLRGYFQNVDGITDDFKAMLNFPEPQVLEDSNSMILHIRGGDYKGNAVHDVNLQKFTKMAMSISSKRKRFLAFTNDREFATSQLDELGLLGLTTFLPDKCDEVQLLVNVAASSAPLICANSTFSWWAGALSRSPRLVVLPRKWYATSNNHEPEEPLFRLPGALIL